MGKKGKIIFGLAVGAMIPAVLTGCGHEHDYGKELKTNETQHYYECSCGEKKDAENHEATNTYSHNDNHHWKDCIDCGYDLTLEQHTFDKEVVESKYLKTEATATTKAVYYKSCICGEKGTETFESGLKIGTISNLAIAGKVYDGTAVNAPTYDKNTDGTATIEYKLKTAEDTTYTTTAPINAGEYTARVSIAETANHTSVSETKDFTISKCVISNLTKVFTYNGQAIHSVELPGAMNLPDDNVKMEMTFATANAGASVTTVKVLVNDVESGNYVVEDCEASIAKATPSFHNVAMSSATITYGDDYQVQCQSIGRFYESSANGFIVQEYYVDSEWTTERPTDAGSYKARLRVLNTTNYNEVISDEVEFEIAPYVLTSQNIEFEYCGGVEFFKIFEFNALDLRLNVNLNDKNVGTKSMTSHSFKLDDEEVDNGNFDISGLTFEIKQKVINITWQSNAEPLYFEGTAIVPSYEFDDKCEGDDLSAELSVHEGNNATYDSTFKMAATLTGADAGNYVLQDEYSGVYTIVDLEDIELDDYFEIETDTNSSKEYYKFSLVADKDYCFYQEGGNSFIQGSNVTIKLFKKSDIITPIETREFKSIIGGDDFDNSCFSVDVAGEYFIEIKAEEGSYACFKFKEDLHDVLNEYGFCSICGEYKGELVSVNTAGGNDFDIVSGETKYFRVEIDNDDPEAKYGVTYGGGAMPQDIEIEIFASENNGNFRKITLSDEPANIGVSFDGYVYIIVKNNGNSSTHINFNILEEY